jgi:hypothetical protein
LHVRTLFGVHFELLCICWIPAPVGTSTSWTGGRKREQADSSSAACPWPVHQEGWPQAGSPPWEGRSNVDREALEGQRVSCGGVVVPHCRQRKAVICQQEEEALGRRNWWGWGRVTVTSKLGRKQRQEAGRPGHACLCSGQCPGTARGSVAWAHPLSILQPAEVLGALQVGAR